MISNSKIQSSWIAKLKANTNIITLVSVAEIRENLWKGTQFVYPNIRVKMGNLSPQTPNNNCKLFVSKVSILVFTEQKSSKIADDIAGVIVDEFWGHPFTLNGVRFVSISLDALVPADVPEDDTNSWLASAEFSCLVQNG